MKSAALALLKGKMTTAPHALTQLMRLHQITCGHLKSDDGTITNLKHNRIEELVNVLSEMEGKAIIWANYIHDIEEIVKRIKKEYGDDSIRIVTVAGWACPCGGTHVRSTKDLKQRQWGVVGIKSKKGVVRVKYAQNVQQI